MQAAADFPPTIGLHYYYAFPPSCGRVRAPVTGFAYDQKQKVNIPKGWLDNTGRELDMDINQPLDHLFPLGSGRIELVTRDFLLWTIPEYGIESLIVFHPENADFVCIEPITPKLPFQARAKKQRFQLRLIIDL